MTRTRGKIRTVQKAGRSYRVTIPHQIRKKMGLQEGDNLWFETHKDHMEIYKVKIRPETGTIISEED